MRKTATAFLLRSRRDLGRKRCFDFPQSFCAMTSVARFTEFLAVVLLIVALASIQVLIGGTRLLFSFPSYGLLAGVGILALFSLLQRKPKPHALCLTSAGIFFGYILWRALISPVPYLARADVYSVLGGLVVYLVIACVVTEAKPRMWIIVSLLLLAMVHVGIGAIQFRDGRNFMPISFLQRFDYGRRASGFYICPNHLAGLLEVLGVFGLSIVCWSRWPTWGKLLIGYAVAVCYVGIALSASRGGYLSVGASLLIFGCLSFAILWNTSSALFWRVGGASIVIAVLVLTSAVLLIGKSDFLSGRAQNVFEKTNMRVDLWQGAIQQWRLSPLLGTGSGTYLFYGRLFRTDRVQVDPVEVHNDYLHLLAEYGLAGAAGFILFLVFHLRAGFADFQRLGPKRVRVSTRPLSNGLALNLGAISAVAAYMVHSIFDFNLHIPANVLLMAFVFGILTNSGMHKEGSPSDLTLTMIFGRLALPALGVILALQCFRLLPAEYYTERSRTALRDYRPASSIFYALKGLAQERYNPFLYLYLGRARMLQGSSMRDSRAQESFYLAALTAFEAARALAPRDETFVLELAFAYDALGRFAEAEWKYQEAIALDPKSISVKKYYDGHVTRWGSAGITPPTDSKETAPASAP